MYGNLSKNKRIVDYIQIRLHGPSDPLLCLLLEQTMQDPPTGAL